MSDDSKKRRKLPDRYPREQVTIIFGEMQELDHVLELLSEAGNYLATLPSAITEAEWRKHAADPFSYLLKRLRNALTEYERFWNLPTWEPSADHTYQACMNDPHELHWKIKEFKQDKIYDPARLACAEALELTLRLYQTPSDKAEIDDSINKLIQLLTRYHAAALEILMGRQAAFKPGRVKGAVSRQTKHIRVLAKNNRTSSAKQLRAMVDEKIIGNMTDGTFANQVKDARKQYPKEKPSTK